MNLFQPTFWEDNGVTPPLHKENEGSGKGLLPDWFMRGRGAVQLAAGAELCRAPSNAIRWNRTLTALTLGAASVNGAIVAIGLSIDKEANSLHGVPGAGILDAMEVPSPPVFFLILTSRAPRMRNGQRCQLPCTATPHPSWSPSVSPSAAYTQAFPLSLALVVVSPRRRLSHGGPLTVA
jgi:hypothetical protein